MPKTVRIQNATTVFPQEIVKTDVIVADGKISDIDPAASVITDEVIDATGLHLMPGIIDDQVHFREPGLTHKEDLASASRACAKGGITTFLEMPNTRPTTTSVEALHAKLDLAASKSLVNYGFYIGATPHNVDELRAAQRTPGIKIFIGSSTGDLLVDEQEALERIFAETTLPITAHCEDEATIACNRAGLPDELCLADHSRIRDHRAALVATKRSLDLALRHQHRFHVLHVSTAAEVDLLATGDWRPWVTAEVCPHHLFFTTQDYERLGTLIQVNPSVKTAADNDRLRAGLLDGSIQVIATDHAPHTLDEKRQPYPKSPSGMPAIENVLALMLNEVHRGHFSLLQLADWMSDAPARVWDIVDKGRIQVGYDADLVLVDVERQHTVHNSEQVSKCGWSPWDGVALTGKPVRTIVGGETVYADGHWKEDHRGREVQFDHARGGYWA